jgi:hypothetical protein
MARKSQKALLENWRPPEDAGDPVGCLATTFTFDAMFFEEECLARFLDVDSLPDRDGLSFLLERENRLGEVYAGVLVDHDHAGVEHGLRWDLLPVRIPRRVQHAKLSMLFWRSHIRVVVASANLTPTGYRTNQEVAGVLDFTPEDCDRGILNDCCGFLSRLVGFVPGSDPGTVIHARAQDFLEAVAESSAEWQVPNRRGTRIHPKVVFTLPSLSGDGQDHESALDSCLRDCRRYGKSPSVARVVSPFFDQTEVGGLYAPTQSLCKGMRRGTKRSVTFWVPHDPGDDSDRPRILAPASLYLTAEKYADRIAVQLLPRQDPDSNLRPWHAKMLWLEGEGYSALLIGSSNFTSAGMGLSHACNAEANLLYVVENRAYGRERGRLAECWPEMDSEIDPENAEWVGGIPEDADEAEGEQRDRLPAGFVSAVYRAGDPAALLLSLARDQLPDEWRVLGGDGNAHVLLSADALGGPVGGEAGPVISLSVPWPFSRAAAVVLVEWPEGRAFWTVNIEDESLLPVPAELQDMTADELIAILAAANTSLALRAWVALRAPENADPLDSAVPPELDALKRHSLADTFLRRVRRRGRWLESIRQRLGRPVWSAKALEWRLEGMLGIRQLAGKMAESLDRSDKAEVEATLELADLLVVLGDVEYAPCDGALSGEDFDAVFRPFLHRLSADLSVTVRDHLKQLPVEARGFWKSALECCR